MRRKSFTQIRSYHLAKYFKENDKKLFCFRLNNFIEDGLFSRIEEKDIDRWIATGLVPNKYLELFCKIMTDEEIKEIQL